jgi:hypothetical protein
MRFRGSISVPPFCRSSARRPCRTLCCIGSSRSGGGRAAEPPCSCSCCYIGPGPGDTYSGSWSSWATLLPAPNLQGKWTTHSPCYNCQNTKPYDRISTVWISHHTNVTQNLCTAVEVLQWRCVRKKWEHHAHTEYWIGVIMLQDNAPNMGILQRIWGYCILHGDIASYMGILCPLWE